MIYLDNAATTIRKPEEVVASVAEAMRSVGNAARGTHEHSLDASRSVFRTRSKIASLFGCDDPARVIFTSGSTESLNIAISGLFSPGDHIITTELEHNSVLRPLYRLQEEKGVSLSFLKADPVGRIDYEDLERAFGPHTRAVVCTHASNLTGNALDLKRIGAITSSLGILLVVDASQTAGCMPIDMAACNIDVLCFTGHKGMMGPQGTGGLCIREGVEICPWKTGGTGVQSYLRTQPREYPTRLEAGTLNAHGIAGLSAAVSFLQKQGVEVIHKREIALMRRFYDGVIGIPGVTVYGDFSSDDRAAIVTLNIKDYDSSVVSDVLAVDYDIATRPGAHCAPLMHRALGTEEQGAVRFSFSWFTTEQEVDAAVAAVREIAR